MKPIKLTMNAFGPFSGSETIDFTTLWEDNVFLITGPTGAGKTTIFDAICFSLYGKASGENRQNENFKSDFAPEDAICSCTFEFELRGKRFTIYRQPPQQKLTNKGTYTALQAKAELVLPDSSVVTGAAEVSARICTILGINLNQFKQIVMLAQGEFQRMLEASSNEKQEIFRRIFSTQLFDRFARELSKKTEETSESINKQLEAAAVSAASLDFGEDLELAELAQARPLDIDALLEGGLRFVSDDRAAMDEAKTQYDEVGQALGSINVEQAEQTNRKFESLKELRKKTAILNGRQKYIAEQAMRLSKIRSAQQVYKSDSVLEQLNGQIEEYKKELDTAQARLPECTEEMRVSQMKLHEAKAREDVKQTMLEHRASLERTRDIFQKVAVFNRELEEMQKGLERLRFNEEMLNRLKSRATLLAQKNELQKHADQLGEMVRLYRQMDRSKLFFAERKFSYFENYSRFLDAQAGILARALDENEPCPVCGSRVHPHLAQLSEGVCTQAQLDATSVELDQLATELASLEAESKACFRQINFMDLFDFDENEAGKHLDEVVLQEEETRHQVEALVAKITVIETDVRDFSGKNSLDQQYDNEVYVLEEIAKVTSLILKTDAEITNKQRQIEDIEAELTAGIQDECQLLTELATVNAQISQIDKQITLCTDSFMEAKTEYDRLCKELEMVRSKLFTLSNQLSVAQNHFQIELVANHFASREDYEEYRAQTDQAQEIEDIINTYNLACTALSAEMNALEIELAGKECVDVEALKRSAEELTARKEALSERKVVLATRIQVNVQALQAIRTRYEGLESLYEEYRDISELSRIANGNNAQRLSFESYVLGAYFDDIISLANVRLAKMTGSRYELRRKSDKEKFGRASGLNLEIIDNYNGKARHITTLSGGESFKTSLALALSLADIVQMYAGGVVIDTMFIDEGFGTLDDESLTSAVQTLTSLGEDGRMVGIISHVSELRECIPARINVTASKLGSTCSVSR